jgi:peptidoglycan-associated lipoprotein
MKLAPRSLLALVSCLALTGVLAGCAKKATEAPPSPPPAPPVATHDTTTTTPPPTPPPQPTTTTTTLTTSDMKDAFFDFDKSDLRDDARAALDQDAKLLRDHADASMVIEGHCDERGTEEYNQALGERRANAARDYLVSAGIPASRLETISYGKTRPFAEGHDESAWSQNRRAHIVVK